MSEDIDMDTRNRRPARSAVSLGLGVALLAATGVAAAAPAVSAYAAQSGTIAPTTGTAPPVAPAPAPVHATVVKAADVTTPVGQGALANSCDATGATTVCEIWARPGTVTVHGSATTSTPVPVWTFASTGTGAVGGASAVLIGTVGVPMTITVHNALPGTQRLGLSIPQLDGVPTDVAGIGVGAVKTYTVTPSRAGTYVYQASLTDDGSRQVAMGLVGALVVRPSSTTPSTGVTGDAAAVAAYDTAEATFDDEALLVYTDIDSRLAAHPTTFNMRDYVPDFHLINGLAYPDTASIYTAHDHKVMLRVVNGSILEKSPTLLGTRMSVFARGSRPLPTAMAVSGRLLDTGDSFDALLTMPADASTRYALYDSPGVLRNSASLNAASVNAPALGGALTFIQSGGILGVTPKGPAVSGFAAAGQPGGVGGTADRPLTVSATFDTAARGGGNVDTAEFYLDTLNPTVGTGTPITGFDITGTKVVGTWTMGAATFAGLPNGLHNLWVRGHSDLGAWGPLASIKVRVDNAGPVVSGLTLSDATVNGTQDLGFSATSADTTTGGSLSTEARAWIDGSATAPDDPANPPAVTGIALTTNLPRAVASIDGTVPMSTFRVADPAATPPVTAGLAEGSHTLYVQSKDETGAWGTPAKTVFGVDHTAPVTTKVTVRPVATNGLVGNPNKPGTIGVVAELNDPLAGTPATHSVITSVEGYVGKIDPVGGTANALYFSRLANGSWSADMPLAWIARYKKDGVVPVFVVGTDAAGNRSKGTAPGELASTNVLVDRTKPAVTVTAIQGAAYPANRLVTMTGTISDTGSGIAYAEYFLGADPGQGRATRLTLDHALPYVGTATGTFVYDLARANILTPRTLTFTVRTRDVAGTWTQVSRTMTTTSIQLFSNGFEAGTLNAWNPGASGATGFATTAATGRIAGLRSLSVAAGAVGSYNEGLSSLVGAGAPVGVLHASFAMAAGNRATGCAGAVTNSCSPNGVTVFSGTNGANEVVSVQYGRATTTGRVVFRVGIATGATGTPITWSTWTRVNAAATYNVTVDWSSATAGFAALRVNANTTLATVTGNTSSWKVATVGVGVLNTLPPTAVLSGTGAYRFDTVVLA